MLRRGPFLDIVLPKRSNQKTIVFLQVLFVRFCNNCNIQLVAFGAPPTTNMSCKAPITESKRHLIRWYMHSSTSNSLSPFLLVKLPQWFLTLLKVLNPASFISAFTEPFVIGKIKYDFSKHRYIKTARHCQCEPGYTVCVLTSAEPLRVTQRTPGV